MKLFKGKYRSDSVRLKTWDYSTPWWYYVTINTKNHKSFFGKIVHGKMVLNEVGLIVENELNITMSIRKNVDLDYYVIMPNHIHVIIIINSRDVETTGPVVSTVNNVPQGSTTLQSNSLGAIIGQLKSVCSKKIRAIGVSDFAWQANYFDRIIRNEKELYKIRNYISLNPLKWDLENNQADNLDI